MKMDKHAGGGNEIKRLIQISLCLLLAASSVQAEAPVIREPKPLKLSTITNDHFDKPTTVKFISPDMPSIVQLSNITRIVVPGR